MEHLLERLERHPAITLHLGGSPPREASPAPQLVVAADGPASATRTALGIGSWGWDYGQQCLTAEVELRGGEPEQAWELLRPEGPFAVLPLGNGLSQLVWSAPASRCRQLASLPPAAFLDSLMGVLPDPLEPDGLRDQPRAFPVGLRLARRLSRGTTVLVGESAHRCHPVGGQGLNLCWRDVAVLHRLATRAASGSLPPHRLAAAYGRRRWPDLVLVLMATDLLVRLHSNRHPLLLPLRSAALTLLAASHPLRRLVLGVMTDGLPRLRPWRRLANLTPW
jgi:2-octaprenyl-6-methoxyphenol hydroxylase